MGNRLVSRAVEGDFAAVDHQGAFGIGCELEIVSGGDDLHAALFGEFVQGIPQERAVSQVEQGCRFVHQQHLRFHREDRGQRHQLALTSGEFVHRSVGKACQTEFVEHRQRAFTPRAFVFYAPQRQFDVFYDGRHDQLRCRVGEDKADVLAYGAPVIDRVEAVNGDPAPRGQSKAVDHPQERGLT